MDMIPPLPASLLSVNYSVLTYHSHTAVPELGSPGTLHGGGYDVGVKLQRLAIRL